ncbi:MAG: IS256 family transposase [Elusimicrobia bacterium]|jgi:putative transposase|nr:IS256 family transposase [Elusimicrobiota bacterium]
MNSIQNNGVKELYFTEEDIEERMSGVKEDFWGDIKAETLRGVKLLLENSMEIEIQDMIGAKRWEHSQGREGMRNGKYRRTLWTEYGWISDIRMPRLREGRAEIKTIKRYQRRAEDVNKLIMNMFIYGVSTRKIKEVLTPLYGREMISASSVSRISKELNKEVEKFHCKSISDDYKYIFLDGIYLKAKSPIRSKRRCILVAYGIKVDGKRELIDYRLSGGGGESESSWESFLNLLYNRGLEGKNIELVIMDGNKGLYNAVEMIWPRAKRQRCWAHKLRNVANRVPKRMQEECLKGARGIYDADNRYKAIEAYKGWSRKWKQIAPEAVRCLEEDLEDLLWFYDCPKEIRVKVRTTNIIERVFREVRRRTRPISCFTNTQSVERIIFAVFNRQNNIWKNKPLKIEKE